MPILKRHPSPYCPIAAVYGFAFRQCDSNLPLQIREVVGAGDGAGLGRIGSNTMLVGPRK